MNERPPRTRPGRPPRPGPRRPIWPLLLAGLAALAVIVVVWRLIFPPTPDPSGGGRDNVKGAATAPVTVEEWADFQ